MKTVPAAALRRNLFETLKRVAYEKEPILIERRGKAIAALVPAESVAQPRNSRPAQRPKIDPKALADLCARNQVKTLYLFGSVLGENFDENSDIDIMFEPEDRSLDYFREMELSDELEALFGWPVDLVSREAVTSSANRFRKRAILESARVIYAR